MVRPFKRSRPASTTGQIAALKILSLGRRDVMVNRLMVGKAVFVVFLLCVVMVIASPAETFKTLTSFNGTDGSAPYYSSLVQSTNGNFYGTTYEGGTNGGGTVFEITAAGKLTTVYSFCSQAKCTDGSNPIAGLVQASNGDFYGTTVSGGANNFGTVFEITAVGKLTTLYSFCSQTNCTDGSNLFAGMVQASNGDFYGTTFGGGANGDGTVFEITPRGKLTTLYSFCSQTSCPDGSNPFTGLVQAASGIFYGTTVSGGANNFGTVFEITAAGKLTTLYSFCSQTSCTDGANPGGALLQAASGTFYGTTVSGGANNFGTVFEITAAGKLTTLYSFCSQTSCSDGANPPAGLVQAANGNFYGTTEYAGGPNCTPDGCGTVFEITAAGRLTTLYSFCSQTSCTDGSNPLGGLLQATNGTLYGTTSGGGADGDGTVFGLAVGLGPFVEARPTSGKVEAEITILGTNLTGTTGVSFNGTAATFTQVSKSEIKTTVPAGATTGKVQVTTPKKTLKSNVVFRVKP
jgi:uncharacterized repeat protein (TIGR03803 family)